MSYKDFITEVPNFPKDGIDFKDISPLLADQETFRSALVDMGGHFDDNLPDYWIGIDSRGFTFAAGLATYFGGGVVCARKEGKLPNATCKESYSLEYGTATLEMQHNGYDMHNPVTAIIVDDVLATGGTIMATHNLAYQAGYDVIDHLVLVDLKFIPKIWAGNNGIRVESVVEYE